MRLRIATRRSPLALWQTEHVAARLRGLDGSLKIELLPIVTAGDRILDRPLAAIGGKGLFLKELEEALIDGRADLAVHSLKDMPAEQPAGLTIAARLEREDARDALVAAGGARLDELPAGSRVGTSSPRRSAQLLALRPDLRVVPMRGNVGTRLAKLERGECDALMLAYAGLRRLGLEERASDILPIERIVPAPGQGIIAVECRAGDWALRELLSQLDHEPTSLAARAERACAAALGGDCHRALGVHALMVGARVRLIGFFADQAGESPVRGELEEAGGDPERLGRRLAARLLAPARDCGRMPRRS